MHSQGPPAMPNGAPRYANTKFAPLISGDGVLPTQPFSKRGGGLELVRQADRVPRGQPLVAGRQPERILHLRREHPGLFGGHVGPSHSVFSVLT